MNSEFASRTTSSRRPPTPSGFALLALCLCLALTAAGCVTKAEAQAQARRAYIAGQQQALLQAGSHAQQPAVAFIGQVKNAVVPWTNGLTLAQGIVQADYYAITDPVSIVIRREGESIPVAPGRLLGGEDFTLLPGDIVEIR